MKHASWLLMLLASFQGFTQKNTDTLWQKGFDGAPTLGMLMADGSPVIVNNNNVTMIDPETGNARWQAYAAGAGGIGYYRGTPYLEANGTVLNPITGAQLNMGRFFKTADGKTIQVINSYIFPRQNTILVYGKVEQGVVEGNIDEVFSVVEYGTGNTVWTRKDLFKTTEQKPEKKGLGGFMLQAGNELTKNELQKFDDAKNPGPRFLTNPLATNNGVLLIPLNNALFAIEAKTGNVIWKKEYAVKKKGIVTVKTSDPTTVIAFNNDSTGVYISRADFTELVDVKNGAPRWNEPMPSAGPASFLHLFSYGLLSLPTKEATLLQNKRISLFDAATGELKWDLKQKFGVQSFTQMDDMIVLNLQNAGDKESVNFLQLATGKLLLEKNVGIEGNVMNMKAIAAGVLVVSDRELCVINKTTGEKLGSIEKKEGQSWILTSNRSKLFVIVSGTETIQQVDYATGAISKLLTDDIAFKGSEKPQRLEWYNDQLLVTSDQNIAAVDVNAKKISFQNFYKAPGRTVAGKILSGTGATLSFSMAVIAAGSTLIGGMITAGVITSEMASVTHDLYPEETNAFVSDLIQSNVVDAKMTADAFKEGVRNVNAISKRFKDTRTALDHLYMLSTDAEGDPIIIQVSKKTGAVMSTTALRKRDKEPDYLVDELGKSLYYIPKITLADEFKALKTNETTRLIKLSLK